MTWSELSPLDAVNFLSAVSAHGDPVFFEPSLCEVHALALPFLDGYSLMRIVNKHCIPYLLLDYLSNGDQHYYLDGSERPFHNIKAQGALSLNLENVADYVDLFISYVYEHGNSLTFKRDSKSKFSKPVLDETSNLFRLSLPLVYQEREHESQIAISKDGTLFVLAPIEVEFLSTVNPGTHSTYRHPFEIEIIEQTIALLSVTSTGEELIKSLGKIELRVLSSPNYQAFVTNSGIGYICMPSAEKSAKYTQVLFLTAVLQGIKQIRAGYLYPHPTLNKDIYARVNYGKNLDLLQIMCKLVTEYEDRNIPEPLEALKSMGFGLLYKAYNQGRREDNLMDVYIQCLAENDMLEEV